MRATTLSLIVCTFERPAALRRLLDALAEQSVPPDEVLVVDGSRDRASQRVVDDRAATRRWGRVSYVRVPKEHRGLTRQRNYGVSRSSGEIVAFLDDDTIPAADYFEQVRSCFERHPEAGGVGGYIDGAAEWRRAVVDPAPGLRTFRWNGWIRHDDYRWRLRRLLKLTSATPPGWMPPAGHGRPVSFLPPDGRDYRVEFTMGGASAWRRSILARHRFTDHFDGYGLYEDLDFCIRASRDAPIFLCTNARLEHEHDPLARPDAFQYGVMVVRNGWYVWRERWPEPRASDRFKWWMTTVLLTACRAADSLRGPQRARALREALGRCWGMISLPPRRVHNRS